MNHQHHQQQPVRFDKHGRRLEDSGHGCGCRLCAQTNAPRYERRLMPAREENEESWSPWRRRISLAMLAAVRGARGRGNQLAS